MADRVGQYLECGLAVADARLAGAAGAKRLVQNGGVLFGRCNAFTQHGHDLDVVGQHLAGFRPVVIDQ